MATDKPNTNPSSDGAVDTFSSRLSRENVLNESNFSAQTPAASAAAASYKPRKKFKWKLWHTIAVIAGVVLIALLLFWLWRVVFQPKAEQSNAGTKFNTTTLDISNLKASSGSAGQAQLFINGNTTINGNIVANSYSGSGADLTNLNANNITSGTLNDARLSPNVALLNATQVFSGNNTFAGSVNMPASVIFGNLQYNFPATQQLGFLINDGNGNLSWSDPSGGCIVCFTNGGNSFGAVANLGTNDAFGLALRTNGATRLSLSPTGAAVFSNTVTATSFFGNGAGLTNLDASNITAGTLDNARLSGSVTTQGNTFNGADQLVQLNALGYLPSLNGGNLTSLNASFVTSGTLADARLSANVALLDANQTFTGSNVFSQPLTVNTLTPTAAMTIGATGQNLSLRGNGSTSWTSTTGGFTTTVGFTGVPAGNVTYQFDAAATPGTYTICTTAGGACGGGGSGNVSTPGGTTNAIPKFTAANTIGDSNITDNGTTVTIGGTTLVANATELRVNGAAGGYAIDATGDINAGTHLRVGGNIVCDSTGCNASGGGGFYIQNSTSQQNAANFFIQSSSTILPTGTIKALGGQSSDLLQFQSSGGSTIAEVYPGGGFNTTDKYYVGGVQISSSNLSDGTNLAKLNANQTFTGNNSFSGTLSQQNSVDSAHELQIINSGGTTLFNIDSTTNKVAIGAASASWPLDVTGDINSSTGLRINGVLVCDSSGCTSTSSGGIDNGTTTQLNANYNIQSSDVNAVVGVLQGKAGQVSDLFQAQTSAGTPVFKIGQAGLTTINNGITLTGGGQTIQNNTGNLNLTASSTTIALNNTTTITSGDGTGLRYAADYAYQPLSLVSRQYVDNAISSIVIGACPTCFLNGGNSFGITASVGTNDNNTLIIETANTPRITLGTNGGIAMQGSTASGNYSTATGSATASGDYSVAFSSATASGIYSLAGGYANFAITAAGRGSLAFGASDNGAVTANGVGSFAGGNQTSTGSAAHYSIAYGYGASTGTNAQAAAAFNAGTATGTDAFAINCGTASGVHSFAGGYCSTAITASGRGAFAYGASDNGVVTAAGIGSVAIGNNVLANNSSGNWATAIGFGARANGNYAMAINGGQTSGEYSFAANLATASGYGATAIGSSLITASGQYAFAGGYGANAITAAGNGSIAFGYSNAVITANGAGSFAGGSGSSTGVNAHYSIAFGEGARTTGQAAAAFNYALASGQGATAIGSTLVTSSGAYSFAGGYASQAITSTSNGSFAFGRTGGATLNAVNEGAWAGGYAISYDITSSGIGSIAFGASRNGAITVGNAEGSFAGGDNSQVGNGANYSIAYGTGTRANGVYSAAFNNATASGTGAFAIGTSTASGQNSFAGGYFISYGITASGYGSMAFGAGRNGVVTAAGEGSFAGGNDSTTGVNAQNAIAFGNGTHATGQWSAAFNNSTASGQGAFASGGATVSSGVYSFTTGISENALVTASGQGAFAGGDALSYGITATGRGSFAFGMARTGAIIVNNAEGSFAGGDNSSVGNGANYSIAYGTGTQANGNYSAAFNNSTASGTGAFSTGTGVASGILSFATGYKAGSGDITASGNGSFAGGVTTGAFTITSGGVGSMAFGIARNGNITVGNAEGSFAGGDNSSVGNGANYSIAYGTGTQANGLYSAAFNNSVAANSGAFSINNATANGIFSFAGGEGGTTTTGRGSFAYGYNAKTNNISGNYSVAMGRDVTANGDYSFAFGYGAAASAQAAFAIGAGQATGYYSFAGYNSTASNSGAFAFGDTNTASGQFSTAFGTLNTASGFNSTAFGRKITVSNSYSFGVSLADASYTVSEAQTAAFMGGYVGVNIVNPGSTYNSALTVVGNGYSYGSVVTSTGVATMIRAGDNASGTLATFQRADGTTVGSITHDGSNTAYNTSSDERLKHDITDTSLGLDTVLKLQVHDFVYNNDSSNTVVTGFIAQELQKLFPEAVSVMDPTTGYLGVDYGKLSPLLAKGIQDLNTKVDNLQNQVDQLKSSGVGQGQFNGGVVMNDTEFKGQAVFDALTTFNGQSVFTGGADFNGTVNVNGRLQLGNNNTGSATISAGTTVVHVALPSVFGTPPSVTATPRGPINGSFWVSNVTASGFDINVTTAQPNDVPFNWQAL